MKITNARSSMKMTLKFTRSDILSLAEVCSVMADLIDFCAEKVDNDGGDGDFVVSEQIEIAEQGLELLSKILINSEDIR